MARSVGGMACSAGERRARPGFSGRRDPIGAPGVDLDAISDAVAVNARLEDKASNVAGLMPMLFGSQTPSVFKRVLMGSQFDSMKSWPPVLKGASNPSLQSQAEPLVNLLAEGDKALDDARTAETDAQEFRLKGDRRALVDKLNALRKATHGKLGEIGHEKKRGSGYAESFFRRDSGPRDLSLDEVERRLIAARAEVDRLQGKRTELLAVAKADAKARADAERKRRAARLAEAERLAAEAEARVKALKAELDDDTTPPSTP